MGKERIVEHTRKIPDKLFAKLNVFDQMHRQQASQGNFFLLSSKSYHELPTEQQEQLHLLLQEKLSILPNQSNTIISSSVAAGEVIQLNPTMFKPALIISPKNPAMLLLEG